MISLDSSVRFAPNSKVPWGMGISWCMQSLMTIRAFGEKLWMHQVFSDHCNVENLEIFMTEAVSGVKNEVRGAKSRADAQH